MKIEPSEPEVSNEKIASSFETFLRWIPLVLPVVAAILYYWGHHFYVGFYDHYHINASLFTAEPLECINAGSRALIILTVAIGFLIIITHAIKGSMSPARWEQIYPKKSKMSAGAKWAFFALFFVSFISLAAEIMTYIGHFSAQSAGDIARPVTFYPEPGIANGKQLYFLGYSNGRYLSYFFTDNDHTPTLVVLRDEKVDSLVFPGQMRANPSKPTSMPTTPIVVQSVRQP